MCFCQAERSHLPCLRWQKDLRPRFSRHQHGPSAIMGRSRAQDANCIASSAVQAVQGSGGGPLASQGSFQELSVPVCLRVCVSAFLLAD
eukprot:9375546-Alexandrium_andersonii.AAC.1